MKCWAEQLLRSFICVFGAQVLSWILETGERSLERLTFFSSNLSIVFIWPTFKLLQCSLYKSVLKQALRPAGQIQSFTKCPRHPHVELSIETSFAELFSTCWRFYQYLPTHLLWVLLKLYRCGKTNSALTCCIFILQYSNRSSLAPVNTAPESWFTSMSFMSRKINRREKCWWVIFFFKISHFVTV